MTRSLLLTLLIFTTVRLHDTKQMIKQEQDFCKYNYNYILYNYMFQISFPLERIRMSTISHENVLNKQKQIKELTGT